MSFNDCLPSPEQWAGVSAATLAVATVSGPVGGAVTALGGTAGVMAANALGYPGKGSGPSTPAST